MISAPTFYQKDAGMMEYWNTGIMVPFEKTNIPSFHHSRFPKKLRFTNPLGMITHGHLKNRFWTKVIGDVGSRKLL
jgi:hypothetical protein